MSAHEMLLRATALADAVDAFGALDPPARLRGAVDSLVAGTEADLLRSIAAVRTSHALLVAYREARA